MDHGLAWAGPCTSNKFGTRGPPTSPAFVVRHRSGPHQHACTPVLAVAQTDGAIVIHLPNTRRRWTAMLEHEHTCPC